MFINLRFHDTGIKIYSNNSNILRVIRKNLEPHITTKNSFSHSAEISIQKAKRVIDIPSHYKKLAYYHNVQIFQSPDKRNYFVTDGFSSAELNPSGAKSKIYYYPIIERDSTLFTPLFFTIILIELLRFRGIYYLHSGGVSKDKRNCILIAGDGNSGKTTLTTSFIKCGYYFLGDDAVFIYNNGNGEIYAHSYGRDFLFTRDGIKYFPEFLPCITSDNGNIKLSVPAVKIFKDKFIKDSRPFTILFTKVGNKKRTTLKEIRPLQALRNLILCSQQVMFDNIAAKPHLDALGKLAAQCRCFEAMLGMDLLKEGEQVIRKLEETICQYQR